MPECILSVPVCVEVCSRVPEFGRVFPSVCEFTRVCSSVSKCDEVMPNICESCQAYQIVFDYSRMCPCFQEIANRFLLLT